MKLFLFTGCFTPLVCKVDGRSDGRHRVTGPLEVRAIEINRQEQLQKLGVEFLSYNFDYFY